MDETKVKLNSFITTAIITTVFTLSAAGCSSSDDDSSASDSVTDTDDTGIDDSDTDDSATDDSDTDDSDTDDSDTDDSATDDSDTDDSDTDDSDTDGSDTDATGTDDSDTDDTDTDATGTDDSDTDDTDTDATGTDDTGTDGTGTDGTDTPIDCGTAEASTLSESDVGDLSGDINAPTPFVVGPGVSTLIASTVQGDLDYATFTVGPCDILAQITVDDFTSEEGDSVAFAALQSGSVFTVPFEGGETDVSALLGFSHFGTVDIGQDILQQIGEGPGTEGFTSPLPAGDYTIWLNQTGAESEATLLFQIDRVIEP